MFNRNEKKKNDLNLLGWMIRSFGHDGCPLYDGVPALLEVKSCVDDLMVPHPGGVLQYLFHQQISICR